MCFLNFSNFQSDLKHEPSRIPSHFFPISHSEQPNTALWNKRQQVVLVSNSLLLKHYFSFRFNSFSLIFLLFSGSSVRGEMVCLAPSGPNEWHSDDNVFLLEVFWTLWDISCSIYQLDYWTFKIFWFNFFLQKLQFSKNLTTYFPQNRKIFMVYTIFSRYRKLHSNSQVNIPLLIHHFPFFFKKFGAKNMPRIFWKGARLCCALRACRVVISDEEREWRKWGKGRKRSCRKCIFWGCRRRDIQVFVMNAVYRAKNLLKVTYVHFLFLISLIFCFHPRYRPRIFIAAGTSSGLRACLMHICLLPNTYFFCIWTGIPVVGFGNV